MSAASSRNALVIRGIIVLLLLGAVAGVLYAKHLREAQGEKPASSCPCSQQKAIVTEAAASDD
jgi:hypothetical protein